MTDQTELLSEILSELKRGAVSHWHTGGVIRMCNCGGPTLRVFTDGRNDYAHCPQCRTTWNLTLMGDWND